ncbi:hypothetical protein C8J56DRAFT_1065435 [Mycena floridula]|nr:hypothetical protein C8J56DRAFT_1065435 [Mycena floridula]
MAKKLNTKIDAPPPIAEATPVSDSLKRPGLKTRKGNHGKVVSKPDMPASCRTSAQVKEDADRDEAAANEQQKEKRKKITMKIQWTLISQVWMNHLDASDTSDDDAIEDSQNEENIRCQSQGKRCHVKKNHITCADITAARFMPTASNTTADNTAGKKHKGDKCDPPLPAAKKAKPSGPQFNGLNPGFSDPSVTAKKPKKKHTKRCSTTSEVTDKPMSTFGRIGDDETVEGERKSLKDQQKGKEKGKTKASGLVAHSGACKWLFEHLPQVADGSKSVQKLFTSQVVPQVLALLGTLLNPWDNPSLPEVQCIVTNVYKNESEEYVVRLDGVWWGLLGYRFSDWRNKLADGGEKAVQAMIKDNLQYDTKEKVAKLVEWLLTPLRDSRSPAFHWRGWRKQKIWLSFMVERYIEPFGQGLFQHAMIMRTLVTHFTMLGEYADFDLLNVLLLVPFFSPCKRYEFSFIFPTLLTAYYSTGPSSTGKYVKNPKDVTTFFSAVQWNETSKLINGVVTRVCIATSWIVTIKNFKPEHWDKISSYVLEWLYGDDSILKGKPTASKTSSSAGSVADEEEEFIVQSAGEESSGDDDEGSGSGSGSGSDSGSGSGDNRVGSVPPCIFSISSKYDHLS